MSKLLSSHSHADTSSSSSHGPQTLNVSPTLTEELMTEILHRLPVKILLRCRCVSKPWCSLIDSPPFAKIHLKRAIDCNTNTGLIIRGPSLHSVDFDSLDSATAGELDEPLKTQLYGSAVVGSCNGLLCLFNPVTDIFLWNPATRKCKKLPTAPTDFCQFFGFGQSTLCGFGYDDANDEYKVMRIQLPDGPTLTDYKVIVYSLKTNSWSRLQGISKQYYFVGIWGMFMAGALHWIAIKTLGSESCLLLILGLDLGVENYREVPMPKIQNKNVNDMCIVCFEKSLSLLDYHRHVRIDVWVMNNYGVANSWCKLFSVEQPEVIRSFVSIRPMAYSKNRKDVLLEVDNKKVVWYNFQRKEVKAVNITNMPQMFDLEVYTESLVQPDNHLCCDGKQLPEQPREKKKRPQRKSQKDKFFNLVL